MVGFRAIISIMFQFLTVVAFDLFFKNVLLTSISHRVRIHIWRFCELFLVTIFFLTIFVIIFFVFILKVNSISVFIFIIRKCFVLFEETLDSSRFFFGLVALIGRFFFDWFNLGGFIAQDIKINEDCHKSAEHKFFDLIHEKKVDFLFFTECDNVPLNVFEVSNVFIYCLIL